MRHIRDFKTFESGSSGSGDVAVKTLTKGKGKGKMGNPSQVSDLRFLKKSRETKKVTESSNYNNDVITRDEFLRLLKTTETFKKNEVEKITKSLNVETYKLIAKNDPYYIVKDRETHLQEGDDCDVNKILIEFGKDREMKIWKLPDYYYLICGWCGDETSRTLHIKCDDIGGTMEIIKTFADLSKDISI